MKAIINVSNSNKSFAKALATAHKADIGARVPEADYHLGFHSAEQLFKELTPARLTLVERLKSIGPSSIYALAKSLNRNYSNVHSDVMKLIDYELVSKQEDGKVLVPWESVQVTLGVGSEAA